MDTRYRGILWMPLAALISVWSSVSGAATPVAYDQTVDIDEGTSITLCGTDADGDPLEYAVETDPEHGDVLGAPPDLEYTPGFSFAGSDSFTFFVDDGISVSNTATVTINQGGGSSSSGECSGGGGGGGNSAPVAVDQMVSTDQNTSLPITLSATDADGDPLNFNVNAGPANGSLSGTAPDVTYTPDTDFTGDDSFTFTVDDGVDFDEGTVSIVVNPANEAPVATSQTVSGERNTPFAITLAGTDPDGDSLTFNVATNPANGSLSGTAPDLTYTPDTVFTGSDSFTFTANDGTVDSAPATVDITITEVFKRLNDTGITRCGSEGQNKLSCAAVGATADTAGFDPGSYSTVPAGQDAHFGRDATDNDDRDGLAGFSFTRLDSNGDPLADQDVTYGTGAGQAVWHCVQDNVTGLVWEVKTFDGGLHDSRNTYTWYNSNDSQNGGARGTQDGGRCADGPCDTEGFVENVNSAGWCGADDWRLPNREELSSIYHWGRSSGVFIDDGFFPNSGGSSAWTSSPYVSDGNSSAWEIRSSRGGIDISLKSRPQRVRLVRGDQGQ